MLQFPELSIAAYNKNPSAMNEPDGVVLVWNVHHVENPEFVFHSQVRTAVVKHAKEKEIKLLSLLML
jgi:dynein intermediate chain